MVVGGSWLIAVPTMQEAEAVVCGVGGGDLSSDKGWTEQRVNDRFGVVVCGVGKANAAGAVGRCYAPERHAGVISMGVCGALACIDDAGNGGWACDIGQVVIGTMAVFADEGVAVPGGFEDIASLGFGPVVDIGVDGVGIRCDEKMVQAVRDAAGDGCAVGEIATVSTCSGTDALAREIASRTGAIAEAMEGAAIGAAVLRIGGAGARFLELRCVSNTTGDRGAQLWDIGAGLAGLARAASFL